MWYGVSLPRCWTQHVRRQVLVHMFLPLGCFLLTCAHAISSLSLASCLHKGLLCTLGDLGCLDRAVLSTIFRSKKLLVVSHESEIIVQPLTLVTFGDHVCSRWGEHSQAKEASIFGRFSRSSGMINDGWDHVVEVCRCLKVWVG
ncbi:hypothetical protein ARMGADRAFT_552896 [Armillaria gallica]|uniref:Uncharacterized protein n=1 Tax=Armillaria gallica TaxID=47427 RepID=A0A2H3CRP8_ARMGA|nr:hypothetical protein ARMGADRAFT_552896 [Armillaria gallica]